MEGGLSSIRIEKSVTLTLPAPDVELRLKYWQGSVNGHRFKDLELITRRFRLPGAYIRKVANISVANAGATTAPAAVPAGPNTDPTAAPTATVPASLEALS